MSQQTGFTDLGITYPRGGKQVAVHTDLEQTARTATQAIKDGETEARIAAIAAEAQARIARLAAEAAEAQAKAARDAVDWAPDDVTQPAPGTMRFLRRGEPVMSEIALPKGLQGDKGLDGFGVAPADETIGTYLSTSGTHTRRESAQIAASAGAVERSFTRNAALNAAPMVCTVSRHSGMGVPHGVNNGAVVAWQTRAIDTDTLHSTSGANQPYFRHRAETAGFWDYTVTAQWAASDQGTRAVELRINGQTHQRKVLPAAQTVDVAFVAVPCWEGSEVSIYVEQTSGGPLTFQSSSRLTARRVGAITGIGTGIRFDAAIPYRGISRWSAVIEPEGITFVPDPTGRDRFVMKIETTDERNSVMYPRVQARSGSFMARNTEWYCAFGVLIPDDFDFDAGGNLMLAEAFGPPFATGGPNRLRIHSQNRELYVTAGAVDAAGDTGWTLALEPRLGRWLEFIFHYRMGQEADGGGFVRMWLNEGHGFVQQPIFGEDQYHYVTMNASNTGSNYHTIKLSYPEGSSREEGATCYYSSHVVGERLDAVVERLTTYNNREIIMLNPDPDPEPEPEPVTSDTFTGREDGDLLGGTLSDAMLGGEPMTWEVQPGFEQLFPIEGTQVVMGTRSINNPAHAVLDVNLADVQVTLDANLSAGNGLAAALRWNAETLSGYLCRITAPGTARILRATNAETPDGLEVLAETSLSQSPNSFTAKAEGNTISIIVGGETVLTTTDTAHAGPGAAGISFANGSARLRSITIAEPTTPT